MKKIVCELCEGMDFAKADGMFTCQGCGTKYTLEQAKAMMIEVEGDASTVAPTVSAPVMNTNQQQIDNLLILATTAYEADNNAEAEAYCNKVIELDAMCYKAWNLKAKAVAWQSKVDDLRIDEAAHAFCKAIDFAPEDEKEGLKEEASDLLRRLGIAMITTRKKRFSGDPSAKEANGFKRDKAAVLGGLLILLKHGNPIPIPSGFLEEVASLMNQSAVAALNMARKAWNGLEHPSDKDLTTFIDWMSNIEDVLRDAIDTSDDDDEADITRYKNLKIVIEEPIGVWSHTQQWNSYWSRYEWVKSKCLNDSAVAIRKKQMADCDKKIKELNESVAKKKREEEQKKAEEKKARIEAYWAEHVDEKEALEKEKADLIMKKDSLSKEAGELSKQIKMIDNEANVSTPSEDEKKKVQIQIGDLRNRKSSLGLFAGKEKKQIDEEIETLTGRLTILEKKIQEEKADVSKVIIAKKNPLIEQKKPIDDELAKVNKRISEIDNRFKEDPEE